VQCTCRACYDQNWKFTVAAIRPTPRGTRVPHQLPRVGGTAHGHLLSGFGANGSHTFVLCEGSTIAAEVRPGLGEYVRRTRAEMRANGTLADVPADPDRPHAPRRWVVTRDITCNFYLTAASLAYGYRVSGPDSWRTAEGHPLADYQSPGWRAVQCLRAQPGAGTVAGRI
jgi:hypothetical protein